MKVLKKIFYIFAALIIAACAFLLACALNPKLSDAFRTILYGNENVTGITQLFGNKNNSGSNDSTGSNVADGSSEGLGAISGENGFLNDTSDVIVTLPEEVGMLTGYQPVEGREQQIDDAVASSIKSTLTTGDTGEALSFDGVLYPYYMMLNESQQEVYKQIYANASQLITAFSPVKGIKSAELKQIFEAVVNDHPELFYLQTGYSVKYEKSGAVVEIQLSYYTLVNDIASARTKFNSAANSIIAGAKGLADDYEKEKYVHDALIANVVYDDSEPLGQSAYSALVGGKTVCAGYARANQYLLQQLGIPCYYCTGFSGENHAWNIVSLSDGFYNEDVTWDDTTPSTYNYFNRTDSDFKPTHVRTGMSEKLPACNGSRYRGLESGSAPEVTVPDKEDDGKEHMKPLRYEDVYGEGSNPATADELAHAALIQKLAEMGLKESDVIWNLDDYYTDCEKQLVACGSGEQHFYIIIPEELFAKLELVYGNNEYEKGFMQKALSTLGMDYYSIQIQAQRLGNGYYKLYHNVVTWKD